MKRQFWSGIAVLLVFFMASCEGVIPTQQVEDEIPSVQYSADRSALTLNLNGGSNRALSRALSDTLAKRGYDFFEVVFYDGADVARASWEIGQSAGIRNVPRGAAATGINYASTDPGAANGDSTTTATTGAAILLIGRKADNTLLAVGRLTGTDNENEPTTGAATTITTTTQTATFTVTSLVAGTQLPSTSATTSSFLTNALDSTNTYAGNPSAALTDLRTAGVSLGSTGYDFPLYVLPSGITGSATGLRATYTIVAKDSANQAAFFAGIRAYGEGNKYVIKDPRFPIGGGSYGYFPGPYVRPTIAFLNNITGDAPFANAIQFAITTPTTGTTDGLAAFAFEIPVFGIVSDSRASDGVADAIVWKIKPGYQTNYYDLDNGTSDFTNNTGPAGGSILLGIGTDFERDYLGIIATGDIDYP